MIWDNPKTAFQGAPREGGGFVVTLRAHDMDERLEEFRDCPDEGGKTFLLFRDQEQAERVMGRWMEFWVN